jgi:outer membrane protein assembly factor BamB
VLSSFDAGTGALRWSAQLPGQYAFSSPPTAANGTVYVGGAGSGGTLYAVRETDGAVLWTQSVANGDASSPALSASTVFVSYACGLVYGFDRVTGAPTWFNDGPCEGGGGSTPVLHNGRVYSRDFQGNEIINAASGRTVGTFQADPAPAFAGSTGVFLSAGVLRATSGSSTLWSFAGDGGLVTAPIIVGGTVYAGSSTGRVYGLALDTGRPRWSALTGAPISGPGEGSAAAPLSGIAAGDGLLVVPAGNRLVAFSH